MEYIIGIPPRFKGMTLEMFKGNHKEPALKALMDGKSILLSGIAGSGKTHLAVALLLEWKRVLIEEGKTFNGRLVSWQDGDRLTERPKYRGGERGLFRPACEFFLDIKESFDNKDGNSEGKVLNYYSQPTILVFDDLGSEKVTDWSRQMAYTLLDRRYRECLQTIITSNLTPSGIAENLDDRIASRLADGVIITMPRKDWRVQK